MLGPSVLAAMVLGAAFGILVGVLPGIGPGVAISLLLPFTFGMSPLAGLALLLGIYVGAFYGGPVTSILIRIPGEASSIMTMFDGYPMARRGEAARALSLAFMAAFTGGVAGSLVLMFAAPPVARIARSFGGPEYATAGALALVCVAAAYRGRMLAAGIMLCLGLFASMVGIDPVSPIQRYTFGVTRLMSGLPLVPMIIGVFGIAQALTLVSGPAYPGGERSTGGARLSANAFRETLRYRATLLRSTVIGLVIGVLPAVGAALASTLAYFETRRTSANPESFGKGNPEGVVAAESANAANGGGAMVTVMTLGIPGDAVTAIIMSVFIIHGVYPGPALFVEQPDLVYGVFWVMLGLNAVILSILLLTTRWIAPLAYVDQRMLGLVILALCFVGTYSLENSLFNTWLALGAGMAAWFLGRCGLPMVPFVLGMVLADLVETRTRQALALSDGSPLIFLQRPVAAAFLLSSLAVLVWPVIGRLRPLRAVAFRP